MNSKWWALIPMWSVVAVFTVGMVLVFVEGLNKPPEPSIDILIIIRNS